MGYRVNPNPNCNPVVVHLLRIQLVKKQQLRPPLLVEVHVFL